MAWDMAHGVNYPASLPAPYAVLDGANTFNGTTADNYFFGGGGNDTIDGGAGIDTATYTATINTSGITDDGTGHFVVATGGGEGTDTLSGVEKIDGAGSHNILLVGNGGLACTRFRAHRVRCHSGAGGGLWNANAMHENSSLRL
jgi:hypothetical protein